jgi:hypothetical protein
LRPLTGHDELALDPDSDQAGNWLLERLLFDRPDAALGPAELGNLDIGNRDRLLAAIFETCFGERVAGMARCVNCGEDFEFEFTLQALIGREMHSAALPLDGPDAEGYYRNADVRFRLPTVADLDAVRALPVDRAVSTLLDRCVAAAGTTIDERAIQEAMEHLAPSQDLDIDVNCPSCERSSMIAFSLESFLLQALMQDRRFLMIEIHRLATAYGWGLEEILSLSREDRRTLVRLAESGHHAAGWP